MTVAVKANALGTSQAGGLPVTLPLTIGSLLQVGTDGKTLGQVQPFWTQNYLINPGCDFIQRLTSTSGTYSTPVQISGSAADTTHDGYGLDRWKCSMQTATLKVTRIDTNGALESGITARYYGQAQQQTGAGKQAIYQIVESVNSFPLASQTLNFQVNLKANTSKTIRIGVLQLTSSGTVDTVPNPLISSWNANTTDPTWGTNLSLLTPTLASGGTISGNGVSCSVTTSWQTFSITVTAPSNAKNLIVVIWTDSQASISDTLSWTQASLDTGFSATTPWNPRPAQVELALCQRYYWKSFNIDTAPVQGLGLATQGSIIFACGNTVGQQQVWFPSRMRATPTIVTYNTVSANANWRATDNSGDLAIGVYAAGQGSMSLFANATPTAGKYYEVGASADAEL